jgi:hypothetical protein
MSMRFLTAEWKHLCLLTFAVPEELVKKRLPPGIEIDKFEDQTCVSFVAFDFLNTKVLGIPWPGLRNFPEINLRFYVKANNRRGVMFVKELVPNRLVAWVARATYNEPYEALPMISNVEITPEIVRVSHQLSKNSVQHHLHIVAKNHPQLPNEKSTEHFFKEHQWGFGINRRGHILQYEVKHPHWQTLPVSDLDFAIDFGQLYGQEWSVLNDSQPISTVCAIGSKIEVYRPLRI